MKQKLKKVLAGLLGVTVIAASFGAGAWLNPREVTVEKPVPFEVVKEVQVPIEVPVEVPVEVIKEVEVPVDNENLAMLLDELYDKDGNLEFLTDDLDEDEIDFVVERLFLTHEWEATALSNLKSDLFDELDRLEVGGTELDDRDMRSLILEDDEIVLEDIDFDDHDAEILVPFRLRQDEEKFRGLARVLIREDEADEIVIEEIEKY